MFTSPANLFGSLVFGCIGFAMFVYGKRMLAWKPMVIGVALMAYPYFVPRTWMVYAIGGALCAAGYLLRD